MSVLCRRNSSGVCRGALYRRDLWCCNYIGICRGAFCGVICGTGDIKANNLFRLNYIGICRGGICVSDLHRRYQIGILNKNNL